MFGCAIDCLSLGAEERLAVGDAHGCTGALREMCS